MKVAISELAWDDILRIGLAIRQDNPARAGTFIDELYASCHKLGAMPFSAPLMPRHAASGIRRRVHGNHLIFYRIEGQAVQVLRVLHGAMNYEPVLFPQEG